MMTRQHFCAVASVVASISDYSKRRERANKMAKFCAFKNPRFDRERFMDACHVGPVYKRISNRTLSLKIAKLS